VAAGARRLDVSGMKGEKRSRAAKPSAAGKTVGGERAQARAAAAAEPAAGADAASLRELIENAPDGIFIADLAGRYVDVNDAGCRIFGHARDRIIGRTVLDFIPPDQAERLWAVRDGLLDGGENVAEWLVRREDGTLTPIEVSDTILSDGRWVGFVRDISRRRELEREIVQSSEQLRAERNFVDAILETAATLIVVLDAEGRVVRFNNACESATGVRQAELLGKTIWLDLIPAEERAGVERVAERLRGGESYVEFENHWQHRDGSRRLIRWRNTVLRDESGDVRYLIGTGSDVTDQVLAEDQARRHLEEASRLQRLQTANELATMLAHELNQPLAAIATYAAAGQHLLHRAQPDAGKLAATLEKISQQALRAGEAIRHLRSFVSRGRLDPVAVDLNSVVRRACTLLSPRARGSGVGLVLELAEDLAPVMGVDVHIEQVLLNLLGNALEAIQGTGAASGTLTVTAQRWEGAARVTVADTGPGIEDETAAHLFEPFFTRKAHGLGVGLPISRSLIEAQGGRLWVEPRVPGGILHFTLPFAT
jgi:PAS domain S-box-containing protein